MGTYQIFFEVFGGLSLFLLGMKYMSEGFQSAAGKKLRSMVAAVTDNRLAGCATGVIVTGIIQSSAITTVLLIGLVNAGVMTLQQAFGVILGANIGTTVTGWLVSLNVLSWGLPVMSVAALGYLFGKTEKFKLWSMILMGVGMIFFGLTMMQEGIAPLRESPRVVAFFSSFSPATISGLLKCILVGAFFTAVIQSSSATVAITITLAVTKVIDLDTAVALVLGENIGTTITAGIAAIGGSIGAKRVACAHIVSKIIGVVAMVILFTPFMHLLNISLAALHITSVAKSIAFAHTLFNVLLVAVFLAFTGPFTRLILKLCPDDSNGSHHITYLDIRMLSTPAFGIQQSFQEIIRMADRVQMLMSDLRACIVDEENDTARESIFEGESALDDQQREVVQFLARLVRGRITTDISAETRKQIRLADEYESISDYISTILKQILKRRQNGAKFSDKATAEMLAMHDRVAAYVASVTAGLRGAVPADYLHRARTEDDSITHFYKDLRAEHMNRIVSGECEVLTGMIYADMMQAYRKVKSHALNIAEAISGEK
ncbi:MAG: Na/Pi cotransporter family protein [Kiritimatiellae bacterium]|nr:Na/Pi cotransporter family protein [Kiritimatiellia bacterium]